MRILGNDLVIGNAIGSDTPLVLPRSARDKHLYICGSTGTGKSKLLESLVRQDILNWSRSKKAPRAVESAEGNVRRFSSLFGPEGTRREQVA